MTTSAGMLLTYPKSSQRVTYPMASLVYIILMVVAPFPDAVGDNHRF